MIRKEPCTACPYRCDVPSGLWAPEEYDKLPQYDNEMVSQPIGYFACHATPEHLCHGWAVVGGWDLLALRIYAATHDIEIPEAAVPLFETHQAAADHGRADIDTPSPTAIRTINRLVRKHPHLQFGDDDE